MRLLFTTLLLSTLMGCSLIMQPATTRLGNSVATAILNQNDPETVRQGAPAYLLLVDGFITENPDSITQLLTGAQLYSVYASVFVEDKARAQRMAAKAVDYAQRALALQNPGLADAYQKPFPEFETTLRNTSPDDVPMLYAMGSTWATWAQLNSSDWNVLANLPKITLSMQRIVTLQEDYDGGAAHLYLGILASLRPPALGGKPEEAKTHFERAIELSHGHNLMTKVLYARHYARLLYDRPLHDQLLNEVLAANPEAPGLTLMNTLAQQQARELQKSADSYF